MARPGERLRWNPLLSGLVHLLRQSSPIAIRLESSDDSAKTEPSPHLLSLPETRSLLFKVRPHPLDENPPRPLVDTVHETVLYVDSPREETIELADQLFVRRRRLEGITFQDIEESVSLGAQV